MRYKEEHCCDESRGELKMNFERWMVALEAEERAIKRH